MTIAYDLIEASIARLRSYASGAVAAAFGDTGPSGNSKFQSDEPMNPDLPYLTLLEPESRTEWENTQKYLKIGIMAAHVYAANSKQARQLGDMVKDALNDAPLTFQEATELLYLRFYPEFVRPSADPGVAIPTERERVIGFRYIYEGFRS